MISINAEAMKIVRQVLADADALGVVVRRLDNGSTLIDMGLEATGGWRAAKAYTQITLAGLAEVSFEPFPLGDRKGTGAVHGAADDVAAELGQHELQLHGEQSLVFDNQDPKVGYIRHGNPPGADRTH